MPKRTKTKDPEIFRYADGTYIYRGTPVGYPRQIERSLKTKDWKQAREEKLEVLKKLERSASKGKKLRIKDLEKSYIADREEDLELGDIRPGTLAETKSILRNHLLPFYGKYKPSEVDEDLHKIYCRQKRKSAGKIDLTNHKKILVHFLKWCKSRKYIKYVPELEVPKPERRERVILDDDEILAIFSHLVSEAKKAPERSAGVMLSVEQRKQELASKQALDLLIYTVLYVLHGMRNSEILGLEFSRVNFVKRMITLKKEHTKTKQPREVPINNIAYSLLLSRWQASNSKYVFPNPRGSNGKIPHYGKGSLTRPWKLALKQAGISRDLLPHDMRATFEQHMNKNPLFTDAQREKMVGASIDVQKKTYLKLKGEDVRGLEDSVNIPQLKKIFNIEIEIPRGNLGEKGKQEQ